MKQFLLAAVLIAIPVGLFAMVEAWVLPAATQASVSPDALGDLSPYQAIVADTQAIAGTGDFAAAERRITDLETMWDEAEPTLRPKDPAAWGNVDDAADAAFSALRAGTPDAAKVDAALGALATVLAAPGGAVTPTGTLQSVAGIAVTDDQGRALPCEAMLADLRKALSDGTIAATDMAAATDLQSKALERCNADDDAHANAFTARALALAGN